MIFHKGRDSHDYKFGAAAWEECELTSDPKWKTPLAAAMMFNLPGAKTQDSDLMKRAPRGPSPLFRGEPVAATRCVRLQGRIEEFQPRMTRSTRMKTKAENLGRELRI